MREALGWTTTESLIGVGLFMVAVLAVVIICTRLARADPKGLAIFGVGLAAAVVLYPIAPLPLAVTAFLLVRRWRRRRRIAAGLAVDPRTARRWAKAAPNEGPAPVAPRVVDPEFEAVAARCQGDAWPQAMIGAGLARRVHDGHDGDTGLAAAAAYLFAAAARGKHTHWDKTTQAEWFVPQVVTVQPSTVGAVIKVEPLPGQGPADFATAMRADRIAAHLRKSVEISPSSLDGLVTITARWRDPMGGVRTSAPAAAPRVLVGRTESGEDAFIDFEDASHVAIQGMTRSGKSALLYGVLAGLAGAPAVRIGGVDGNRVTLAPWAGVNPGWVSGGVDSDSAIAVLERYTGLLDERLSALLPERTDKLETFTEDRPLEVVVLEEFTGVLTAADSKAKARIRGLVGRLVREGAKVGIRVVLVAQRMDAEIVGGDIRGQFGTRITMRVDSVDAVRMLHADFASRVDMERLAAFSKGRAIFEVHGAVTEMQADYTTYGEYLDRVEQFHPAALTVPDPETEDAAPDESTDDAAA